MEHYGRASGLPSYRRKLSTDTARRIRAKACLSLKRMDKSKVVALSFVLFVSLILYVRQLRHPYAQDANLSSLGKDTIWGMTDIKNNVYAFAIVTDLDQLSKDKAANSPTWKSYLKFGTLTGPLDSLKLSWMQEHELTTHLSEANRGLELSELVTWQNKLYTFDDRSGIVFEVVKKPPSYECIARYVLTEGDGLQAKGQKTEWATVKDGSLYVGSFGKEYTKNGVVTNKWNLWIKILDPNGLVEHVNWEDNYNLLRVATNTRFTGYMIHEAIHWDPYTRQWFVLPRRISTQPYDEKLDEKMGSNYLLVVDEHWTSVTKRRIGPLVPERGWSSFKFLPGSKNTVIVALKTAEDEDKATGDSKQESYITVFDLEGNELREQTKIPGEFKYEGLEFV